AAHPRPPPPRPCPAPASTARSRAPRPRRSPPTDRSGRLTRRASAGARGEMVASRRILPAPHGSRGVRRVTSCRFLGMRPIPTLAAALVLLLACAPSARAQVVLIDEGTFSLIY